MPVVEYRFRVGDDAPTASVEWMRQLGVALATAAWVLPDDTVEIYAGTVSDPLHVQAELVDFQVPRREDALAAALRSAGASRLLSVAVRDGAPDPRLVPFAFLHESTLVRPFWHGPSNEADLRNYTGLTSVCSRDDEQDELMCRWFGAADLGSKLDEFIGPCRSLPPPPRTSIARTVCRRPS